MAVSLAHRLDMSFVMIELATHDDAHLAVHTKVLCEHGTTLSLFTVVLTMLLVACSGGGKRTDTYAKANDVQGQCCESLAGAERDRCLSEIVRIEDPEAAKTSTNQATYACVVEHFVCNPQTGRPTQTSAQAQYDCIEDQAR